MPDKRDSSHAFLYSTFMSLSLLVRWAVAKFYCTVLLVATVRPQDTEELLIVSFQLSFSQSSRVYRRQNLRLLYLRPYRVTQSTRPLKFGPEDQLQGRNDPLTLGRGSHARTQGQFAMHNSCDEVLTCLRSCLILAEAYAWIVSKPAGHRGLRSVDVVDHQPLPRRQQR